MNFIKLYQNAPKVKIEGTIFVPQNYHGESNSIMPDEIVAYCVDTFGLNNPGINTIDPMCGVGTIPRVVNKLGGDCIGIEIDEDKYLAARASVGADKILRNDFRRASIRTAAYNCLFTSMPFIWFKDKESASNLESNYMTHFNKLLSPGGFMLIDTIKEVERNNEIWPVAQLQSEYFERNGMVIDTVILFESNQHIDSTGESVILKVVPVN